MSRIKSSRKVIFFTSSLYSVEPQNKNQLQKQIQDLKNALSLATKQRGQLDDKIKSKQSEIDKVILQFSSLPFNSSIISFLMPKINVQTSRLTSA